MHTSIYSMCVNCKVKLGLYKANNDRNMMGMFHGIYIYINNQHMIFGEMRSDFTGNIIYLYINMYIYMGLVFGSFAGS